MINYDYKKLCPFKWFVLQNFPFIEEDFDAITNYQLFCKLGEEINKIINSVNNAGEQIENLTNAFNSLETYVNNYFENLDVQDEINNKLDEMAENGELINLIAEYLNLGAVLTFNTVSDMVNSESLVSGSVARTLGRSTINDMKGATYKIVTLMSHVADGINTISLGHDDLYAQLIYENKITTLDTLQTLKSATNLTKYDFIKTLGYNSINDGGNGFYYIVDELEEEESANNGNIVELQNNLYAKLIIDDIVNVKQFGAIGDNETDDSTAIQNAINYSSLHDYKKIYIPNGEYKLTSKLTTPQAFNQPIISGENTQKTKLIAGGESAIKFKGGSGQLCNSYLENITITGNGENIGVELEGVCGYNIINCHFGSLQTGVLMHNNASGEFTEFCQIINSRFNSGCHTVLEYKHTNGTESFHGSGLVNSNMVQAQDESNYKIIIGEGCMVYNAPLTFSCWKNNTAKALIVNNAGGTLKQTFYGNINLEIATQGGQLIVDTGAIYFNGNIACLGQSIVKDNIILCDFMQVNANRSITTQRKNSLKNFQLNAATTNICYVAAGTSKIVHIVLSAPMYEYQYTLLLTGTRAQENVTVTQLAAGEGFNQAGYGACTFGHSGRNLTITNSNFASHTVSCNVYECPISYEQ